MKTRELKTGMLLEFKSGETAIVLLGTENGDIAAGETWFPLKERGTTLLEFNASSNKLINVYQPFTNSEYIKYHRECMTPANLIWNREKALEDVENTKILEDRNKLLQELELLQSKVDELHHRCTAL